MQEYRMIGDKQLVLSPFCYPRSKVVANLDNQVFASVYGIRETAVMIPYSCYDLHYWCILNPVNRSSDPLSYDLHYRNSTACLTTRKCFHQLH